MMADGVLIAIEMRGQSFQSRVRLDEVPSVGDPQLVDLHRLHYALDQAVAQVKAELRRSEGF